MRLLLALLLCVAPNCFAQMRAAGMFFSAQNVGAAAPAAENTLTNGVAAYYTFNAGATDSSTNALALTTNGTVGTIAALLSNGADFTASNSANYYSYGDDNRFSALANSLTIAVWVNTPKTNNSSYIAAKDGDANGKREWLLQWSASSCKWAFVLYTNSTTTYSVAYSDNAVALNAWYFIVAQADTTNLVTKIRVGSTNAPLSGLSDWDQSSTWGGWGPSGTGTNSTGTVYVGRRNNGWPFPGVMDELGIWDRLLTDAEITNLWNNGAGKTWPLD